MGLIRSLENKYKKRLASSPTCKCGAEEQNADDVILECLIPKACYEHYGLEKLDEGSKILLPTTSSEILFQQDRIRTEQQPASFYSKKAIIFM